MALSIIVMGAAGRMGRTLVRLIREAGDLSLAAALERSSDLEKLDDLKAAGVPVSDNIAEILTGCPKNTVIVDFTAPEATLNTLKAAAAAGVPMVIGTTGFSDAQLAVLAETAKKVPLFRSANMSVGVNVIMDILPQLTAMLGDGYDAEILEIHHNKKKDAPSGTALLLAEPVLQAKGLKNEDIAVNRFDRREPRRHDEVGIQSLRGGDVVGVHTVYYFGAGERIEITHHAHSRDNFAIGALRASRWLSGRQAGRLYNMQDVLHADA